MVLNRKQEKPVNNEGKNTILTELGPKLDVYLVFNNSKFLRNVTLANGEINL